MLYDHAQYISLKKLKYSANLLSVFLNKKYTNTLGISPKTVNNIMPGIKKSLKGDRAKMDKGKPPNNFPEGEIIKAAPPPTALNPRKDSNIR